MLNSFGEFQRILVLGGKSDLALSTLEFLPLSVGAEVYLCGRSIANLDLSSKFKPYEIYRVEIDFTDISLTNKTLSSIFQSGDIDLVIFAYANLGNELLQLEEKLFEEVLHNNFFSQAIILNHVNAKLVKQMHGQILVFSSVAGIRPRRRNFVYGVTKFGIDFISQGLQKNNSDKNVFITIIRPGFVHTKMTVGMPPAPFATDKETVAKVAVNALRRKKRIVYAPRILSLVMFILKHLPEKLFNRLDK
jgi:decaprenylphospho-beta-D-erythro-pentofuranosid-2-ulose 2-reductase